MPIYFIAAYIIGVNIASVVMLFIQKKEKNLSPCERSFSDTNSRTDTESAAVNNLEEQGGKIDSIGNSENTQAPVISTFQNENNQENNQNNSKEIKQSESDITIKLNLPKEEVYETYQERKQRLKEERLKAKLKKARDKSKKPVSDFTIMLLAFLGGSVSIYAGMFVMKYKLKSVPFMLLIPTIIGFNIYLVVKLLSIVWVWGAVRPIV